MPNVGYANDADVASSFYTIPVRQEPEKILLLLHGLYALSIRPDNRVRQLRSPVGKKFSLGWPVHVRLHDEVLVCRDLP